MLNYYYEYSLKNNKMTLILRWSKLNSVLIKNNVSKIFQRQSQSEESEQGRVWKRKQFFFYKEPSSYKFVYFPQGS
jgi:hypothetical protein